MSQLDPSRATSERTDGRNQTRKWQLSLKEIFLVTAIVGVIAAIRVHLGMPGYHVAMFMVLGEGTRLAARKLEGRRRVLGNIYGILLIALGFGLAVYYLLRAIYWPT